MRRERDGLLLTRAPRQTSHAGSNLVQDVWVQYWESWYKDRGEGGVPTPPPSSFLAQNAYEGGSQTPPLPRRFLGTPGGLPIYREKDMTSLLLLYY